MISSGLNVELLEEIFLYYLVKKRTYLYICVGVLPFHAYMLSGSKSLSITFYPYWQYHVTKYYLIYLWQYVTKYYLQDSIDADKHPYSMGKVLNLCTVCILALYTHFLQQQFWVEDFVLKRNV